MRDVEDVARALASMGEDVVGVAAAMGFTFIDDDGVDGSSYEIARANRATFIYVSPRANELVLARGLIAALNYDGQLAQRVAWREAVAERLVALLAGDPGACASVQQAKPE